MTYRGWYEKRTIAICRPVGVEFDSSTKQLLMITLSPETKAFRLVKHNVKRRRNIKSSPNECESSLYGSIERLKIDKNTIFCKNFHLLRNTLFVFDVSLHSISKSSFV